MTDPCPICPSLQSVITQQAMQITHLAQGANGTAVWIDRETTADKPTMSRHKALVYVGERLRQIVESAL